MSSSFGPRQTRQLLVGRLDMYRKVPADLMEGTRRGSLLSLVALAVMTGLFWLETYAYWFQKQPVTDLRLDQNKEQKLRVNINITMMDLRCDYTVIDVVSVLGTEQNISSNIYKWHVDAAGVRQRFQGRNKEQRDLVLFDPTVSDSLEYLYGDGEDAVSLDAETLRLAQADQEYLFVDFYASWCSHCRDLAPTWEILAEIMVDVAENLVEGRNTDGRNYTEEEIEHAKKLEIPVMVAKVDCVQNQQLCAQEQIMAYPTLRLYVDGERWKGGDYRGHRTVVEMADWLQQIEDAHKTETENDADKNVQLAHEAAKDRLGRLGKQVEENHEFADKIKRHNQRLHHSWVDAEHPGCQLAGHLLLERAPGHFAIMARSPHHEVEPKLANVSHVVHELSVGEIVGISMIEKGTVTVPNEVKSRLSPMNSFVYVNQDLHEAYHHYLKVITTNIDGLKYGQKDLKAYQLLESSQLAYYKDALVPEAKFILDLSPISVSYRTTTRHWYDYLTSIMAIIGGTFTVVGMIESGIHAIANRKKRY